MWNTIVIFAGSNNLKNDNDTVALNSELVKFLNSNKNNIDRVLFWGWIDWVMWVVYNAVKSTEVKVKWYSLSKYRESDQWNWIDLKYYSTDDDRMEAFYKKWDIFIALPWAFWTLREILTINELIKRNWDFKNIYVHTFFKSFFRFVKELENDEMIAREDMWNIKRIDRLDEIKLKDTD